MSKLSLSSYKKSHVTEVAKSLLGKCLHTKVDGQITAGFITEVEAYSGRNDRGSHAHNGKRSKRTEVMYGPPGYAYVYLCYGIHRMFNVVCNDVDMADAVLVRAIQPAIGVEEMMKRRNLKKISKRLTCGPGIVCQALGIELTENGTPLNGGRVWIAEKPWRRKEGLDFKSNAIEASPRIGIDYAGEDANLPWRYTIRGNDWVSA